MADIDSNASEVLVDIRRGALDDPKGIAFPAKNPEYRAYYNKEINELSRLVMKEASDNRIFFYIYIGMDRRLSLPLFLLELLLVLPLQLFIKHRDLQQMWLPLKVLVPL